MEEHGNWSKRHLRVARAVGICKEFIVSGNGRISSKGRSYLRQGLGSRWFTEEYLYPYCVSPFGCRCRWQSVLTCLRHFVGDWQEWVSVIRTNSVESDVITFQMSSFLILTKWIQLTYWTCEGKINLCIVIRSFFVRFLTIGVLNRSKERGTEVSFQRLLSDTRVWGERFLHQMWPVLVFWP